MRSQPDSAGSTYKCSDLWHQTEAALKLGLGVEWWSLDMYDKAWLLAALETQDLLAQIFEYTRKGDG